ncbi:MAG: hypothetical protein ACJ746_12950 [Bryobacteraceae bacterium]
MMFRTLGSAILCSLSAAVCSFAAADNGLLSLVPDNSPFVVGIDILASRSSDLGRYLTNRFSGDAKGFEQLTAETGFDPRRDLASVVFAGTPAIAGSQYSSGLVLARGVFDQNKIRSAALAKGAVVQSVSGVDFYVQRGAQSKHAFAFLANDVFATGSLSELRHAVANRLTPATLDPQLNQLISRVASDNDVWFASTLPLSRFTSHLHPDLDQSVGDSQTLQAVSAASGGLRFGSSVQLTLDAVARSDKDASALADVLRFVATLLEANGQSDNNDALLASALNQMLVSASGPNVHLSLSIPEATLEQLAEIRPQRHGTAH